MRNSTEIMNYLVARPASNTCPIETKGPAKTLMAACSSFVSRCMALNLTDGTLSWYQNILRELVLFLSAKGIGDLPAIEPMHLTFRNSRTGYFRISARPRAGLGV